MVVASYGSTGNMNGGQKGRRIMGGSGMPRGHFLGSKERNWDHLKRLPD